jgi:hypothetical protein
MKEGQIAEVEALIARHQKAWQSLCGRDDCRCDKSPPCAECEAARQEWSESQRERLNACYRYGPDLVAEIRRLQALTREPANAR